MFFAFNALPCRRMFAGFSPVFTSKHCGAAEGATGYFLTVRRKVGLRVGRVVRGHGRLWTPQLYRCYSALKLHPEKSRNDYCE